jgi:hypothetical protein
MEKYSMECLSSQYEFMSGTVRMGLGFELRLAGAEARMNGRGFAMERSNRE